MRTAAVYTHKSTGWTRTATQDGSMRWIVHPTDGTDDRIVRFMSAHSWANDPTDDRARQNEDRIVLLSGPALPEWAIKWLEKANRNSCESARDALRAAIDDADNAPFRDGGW